MAKDSKSYTCTAACSNDDSETLEGHKRVTVPLLATAAQKIACITAYDYTFARLADAAGIDLILVGDSLGNVVQGLQTTLPVTLDEMIYHTKCVCRGVARALVVTDMPFLSYQTSLAEAVQNCGRVLKESGAQAVKLEGGVAMAETIAHLVAREIPVLAHVGLMPQAVHRMGGYRVQGRRSDSHHSNQEFGRSSREEILRDANAVAEAGAFAVVLEGVPEELGTEITAAISIPTIGIGAGRGCRGQVLVLHDLLGLTPRSPRFVKRYMELGVMTSEAIATYVRETREGEFPSEAHTY